MAKEVHSFKNITNIADFRVFSLGNNNKKEFTVECKKSAVLFSTT